MQKTLFRTLLACVGLSLGCLSIARQVDVKLESLSLMSHAVKVAALDANADDYTSHYWISDKDLLLFHVLPTGRYKLVRHHLPDGKEYPLTSLERLFNTTGSCPNWSAISPDGKWLGWQGSESKADSHGRYQSVVCFAQNDGSHSMQQLCNGSIPFWGIDSRHWLLYEGGTPVHNATSLTYLLGNVELPGLSQTVKVPYHEKEDAGFWEFMQGAEVDLTHSEPHTIMAHLLSEATSSGKPDTVREFETIEDRLPAKKHTIQLPYPSFLRAVRLAPGGKRLAWEIVYEKPTPLSDLTKALSVKLGGTKARRYMLAIWEGSTDLQEAHEVGEIDIGDGPIMTAGPSNLQWLPGGNSLSFEYNKGLYVVRLPPL